MTTNAADFSPTVAAFQDDAPEYDLATPRAGAMIYSLRAFGYDLATALADLIDNSIAANAKNVWLDFHWNGAASYISALDDGDGMTETQLLDAMRPGSQSPLAERDPADLGRYGLGLKTASFSQAKRLTVGTKQGDTIAVRCWDLDYVTECGDWRLLRKGSETFAENAMPYLEAKTSGTVVFWEAMDRITPPGTDVNSEKAQNHFYYRADQVKAHLAMVFHRFLDPRENPGKTPLKLWINEQPIAAWDPFLSNEKATQLLAEETVPLLGCRLMSEALCPAAPCENHGGTAQESVRCERLERTAGFLCVSQSASAGGGNMARSGLSAGGALQTGAYSARHPEPHGRGMGN